MDDDGAAGDGGDAAPRPDAEVRVPEDAEPLPESCLEPSSCTRASDCRAGQLCIAAHCEPAAWSPPAECGVYGSGCIWTGFPDACYRAGPSEDCPARPGPLGTPECSRYLELGAAGPEDDAHVVRLLYDLWRRGRQASPPTRPKVVMVVGDSISMSTAFLTEAQFDCALPDLPFEAGYRFVGQPTTFNTVQTALEGQRAAWGAEILRALPWYAEIRPEVATVMFGTNELWSGGDSLEEYVGHMRQVVDRLLERNVIPILLTPPPGTYEVFALREICGVFCEVSTNYSTADFANAVRDLAAERMLPVVDVHGLFLDYDRPDWAALLSDGVHPCSDTCFPAGDLSGYEVMNDAVARMYKFLETRAMGGRCPGAIEPPEPPGYGWNAGDVLSNFRGAEPRSYCPDPVAVCR